MSKATHALAAAVGCAAGFMMMAVIYAECFFRTCENEHEGKGFKCSNCHSMTDYEPKTPFRVCPMCGAYVKKECHI